MPMIRNMVESRGISPQDVFGTGADLDDMGSASVAGVKVNQETGGRVAAAFSCIRILSETVGSFPWAVYRDVAPNEAQRLPGPRWVRDQPNPDQTRVEFVEQLVGSLNTDGNAYAVMIRDSEQTVQELWPQPPEIVVPRYDQVSGKRRRVYLVGDREIPEEDVLHVRAFSKAGDLKGISPIEHCARTFGVSIATEEYASNYFANSSRPSGVLQVPGDPGKDALKQMARSWRRAHSGPRNAGIPGVLTHGTEWQQLTIPNNEAQFLESRKFTRSEIAGIYRVPPHLIADLERATFSNIEHQDLAFLKHSIRPWLVRLESRLNLLLPRGQYVKFNADALLRGTTKDRYEAHRTSIETGIHNLDEVRALENLPPLPDGKGQVHYRPVNVAPHGEPNPPSQQNVEE